MVTSFNTQCNEPFGHFSTLIVELLIIKMNTGIGMNKGVGQRITMRRVPDYFAYCFVDKTGHKSPCLFNG
jgi:hypothetical protein